MPPEEGCVPSTIAVSCPNNYAIVVRSAEYGVAKVAGSCSYTPGDCVADAMSIVVCTTDAKECRMFATKRKLPQCNDEYGSYVHVEYDCVPISMDDSSKEYNVCQNGSEITTDHGIIKSPGYPTQFQTTTFECFRAIHVPSNKAIRLWLSDIYIASSTNCANDHVYVVDSVQTYRNCGNRRIAYPYLCSSTILIQYWVKTSLSLYRGMRMYFEIVDRSPNDNCPNPDGTVTPLPSSTTTISTIGPDITTPTPPYVILGIASPVRSFQLCKGQSSVLECPTNYAVAIRLNVFGVTQSDQCEPHDADKHCVITTDPTFMCFSRCTYMYTGNRVVPSCNNKIAAYQYVEYQCIPTQTEIVSPNTMCPSDGSKVPIQINRRGRFQSLNYPTFQKMNCTYRLTTKPGDIMHIYSLDISLNNYLSDCQSNKLTLIEDGETEGLDFCEQRSYSLIYSSCSNELDLRYVVNDDSHLFSYGAQLYIESQARPSDWSCGKPLTTPTSPPTEPPTQFTTPTAIPLTNETSMFSRDELEHDICYGSALSYSCPQGYTFMILGAYYGVKQGPSNKCGFVQGDCVQEALSTVTQCRNDAPSCFIQYSTKRRLAHCSDNYADYLHITSQCVPSRPTGPATSLTVNNICDTNNPITGFNGVVTSPNFPTYKQTNDECKRTITGMTDRILKIWINEMALSSGGQRSLNDDLNEPDVIIYKDENIDDSRDLDDIYPSIRDTCIKDYLIINSPLVAYVYCGTRKLVMPPICDQNVVIQYKTTSPPSLFFKGFKFYFEWVEKPPEIICPGTISPGSTTTPINKPVPIWAQNLELSPILSEHVCRGSSITIECPRGSDYVLSIVDSSYAVTDTGICDIPSWTHCHQEASLSLTCTHKCVIEYYIPKPLVQCQNKIADYLNIDYECIPTRLPNNENPIDICASTADTIAINTGIIVSPQYPTLGVARTCSKRIETLPGKIWMVFIVDLFLEGSNDAGVCNAASLTISDANDKFVLCGLQQPEYLFASCSNVIDFKFISTHQALGYRGFKVYFQTMNASVGWQCKQNITTIATTTTTRPPATTSLIPPSLQIAAYGGTTNGTRQYCTIPFIYQGNPQSNCLRIDPPSSTPDQPIKEPWCSLTSNFDTDRQWGFCDLGVTESTLYDVCRSQTQQLKCPPGYVIDIITADYAAKPDGNIGADACVYDQNDCFQSDASTIQSVCAGKTSCIAYHFVKTLASCQNRPSAYFHIDYTCIPNDIREINTYNMCNNNTLPQSDTRRGYIVSPNFPSTQSNIDCTFNLQALKPNQDIYLYVLDMDLNNPNTIGQSCSKDRLIIGADNNIIEMCGRSYTNFILNTCHSSVSLQLIRTSDARGRGVKFYFEFRERPPHVPCPDSPTTPSRPTTVSPSITPAPIRPVYFPHPSTRLFKALCYPDLSSLFGTNNFQCPRDYVIVIHRAFYGKGTRCDFTPGDCTSEADIVYRTCSGKQACSVSFLNIVTLPECDKANANYLFVEYQCLPTPTIAAYNQDLCTGHIDHFAGESGILKSPSYPTYTQTQCANVTLSSIEDSNLRIYMYLLDLNIGPPDLSTGTCTNDYLSLSYQCNNQLYDVKLCDTRSTEVLFSTCTPTDKIFASYSLLSQDLSQRGFALLYHLVPASEQSLTTTAYITTQGPGQTTTTTQGPVQTTTTGPTTPPPGPGPVIITEQPIITCVQKAITIKCDTPNYGLVLHKVQLGANPTGVCSYSSTDCFEDRLSLYNSCGGKPTCYMFPPLVEVKGCNKLKAAYLYVEYECLPLRPKLNLDICSSKDSLQTVEGGAIISSLNYASATELCKIKLQSNTLPGSIVHKAFKIYILSMNLPTRSLLREQGAQCTGNDPFVDIDDPEGSKTRLCGNSHTRYILETCSNEIEIQFQNLFVSATSTKYRGFEIYAESIQNARCRPTPSPITPTPPFIIKSETACSLSNGRERVNFGCDVDYGLVFLQSNYFATRQPDRCDITQYFCTYPSEQPQAQCSGQQTCSYVHTAPLIPGLGICQNRRADSLQFDYQCLPMRPSTQFPKVTLCTQIETSLEKGFIETQGFPRTYEYGRQQCSLSISVPNSSAGKKYSIYLYIIDLSIRDTSTIAPLSPIECFDSIKYTDGDKTGSICGKIDQPVLEFYTDKNYLNLTLNISQITTSDQWNDWQGARLFYIIGEQSVPTTTSIPQTLTTATLLPPTLTTATVMTTGSGILDTTAAPKHGNKGGMIAGIILGVLAVLIVIIAFIVYRRRSMSQPGQTHVVKYDTNTGTIDGTMTNGKPEKASSIPTASLKGPAPSTFVSPFFKKPETTETQET